MNNMQDCQNYFYLCLTLCGVILTMLTMFFNYSLKLDWRTAKLEKKNGHEQEQIKKLKGEVRLVKALLTLTEEARQRKLEEEEDEDEWND